MLDAAHESGDTFAAVILGVDLTNEDGGKSDPSGLVDMIRRRHGLPLLLMINCKQTSLLSRSLSDEGIKVVVKPVRRDIIHRNLCCLFGLQQAATAEAASASAAPTAGEFSGLRVLVAEDNDFNRTLVTKILESAGVTVAAAATGHQALELAREQGFDVVIMDLHLPGMDGCETARRLRRLRPDMAQTAIIALTADVFFDDQEKLRAAEMDACLLKPLDEARLWNTIRRLHPGVAVEPAAGVNHGPSSAEIRRLLRPKLVTSIRDHRQQIGAAVDRFDLSVLRSLVHELKGVVGYFGLSDLCREVTGFEQAIDCGADPMELTRRFQRIDELVEEMAAAEPETAS